MMIGKGTEPCRSQISLSSASSYPPSPFSPLRWPGGTIRPGRLPRRAANQPPAASMLFRSGRTRRRKIPYALRVERLACRRIKACSKVVELNFEMSRRHTHDLARLCTQLVRKGNDFPTVWGTLLKGHSLVNGPPRQHHNGIRSVLEIHLFTGERLVFDADAKQFSIK